MGQFQPLCHTLPYICEYSRQAQQHYIAGPQKSSSLVSNSYAYHCTSCYSKINICKPKSESNMEEHNLKQDINLYLCILLNLYFPPRKSYQIPQELYFFVVHRVSQYGVSQCFTIRPQSENCKLRKFNNNICFGPLRNARG